VSYYLGPYRSETSFAAYDRVIAEYVAVGRIRFERESVGPVATVLVRLLKHAQADYVKNGKPRTEYSAYGHVAASLARLFVRINVDDYGPLKLNSLWEAWLKDIVIARLYADLVQDEQTRKTVFERIDSEHKRTVDMILQITCQSELLERSPVLLHSIQRRNPYVDPLSFIQLVLLRRLRSGAEPREEMLTAVLESINGIAAGLKNTG
jgi:hypothetical protein